jgi:hypothetical protein
VSSCPRCGEPSEPGQLVCLECGGRLALKHEEDERRRPLERLPAVALLLCVVIIGAAAFGFVLRELTDGDGDSSAADRQANSQPAAKAGSPQGETETEAGATQQPSKSLLLEWPKDLTAYTVVIVSSSDRPAAKRVAQEAAQSGLEAGMLRSDDFNLGTGLWIVFAGRFDSQASAERQAANLAERYPGAYPTQVKPAS